MNSVRSNNMRLKYQMFSTSCSEDIEVLIFDFVPKTQFLFYGFFRGFLWCSNSWIIIYLENPFHLNLFKLQFFDWKKVVLHSGGSVCLANLGGSCLHSGSSWRPGVFPSPCFLLLTPKIVL